MRETIERLEKHLGAKISSSSPAGGGCIANACIAVLSDGREFFVKSLNHSSDVFRKEANGLRTINKTGTIRVPEVVYVDSSLLVLEKIEVGQTTTKTFKLLAQQLAEMHRCTEHFFGFQENNYLGLTEQVNTPKLEVHSPRDWGLWSKFFVKNRIQIFLAALEDKNLLGQPLSDAVWHLTDHIPELLSQALEPPTLIHGDLWSGNYLVDENGYPVLIDPAVYYGHREADLAMARLFGGFPEDFFRTYENFFPLRDGHSTRLKVYQLHHLLNHILLFGKSYKNQTLSLVRQILSAHDFKS